MTCLAGSYPPILFNIVFLKCCIKACWPASRFLLTELKPTICARLQLANSKRTFKNHYRNQEMKI